MSQYFTLSFVIIIIMIDIFYTVNRIFVVMLKLINCSGFAVQAKPITFLCNLVIFISILDILMPNLLVLIITLFEFNMNVYLTTYAPLLDTLIDFELGYHSIFLFMQLA